jgi:hypothetical protein
MSSSLTQSSRLRWLNLLAVFLISWISFLLLNDVLFAKPLFSYRDDRGTNVITDNYDHIPMQYRAKVITIEQESDSPNQSGKSPHGVMGLLKGADNRIGGATIDVPGLTSYQSHALTLTGSLALFCFVLRQFSNSQALRFLALWGLIMLGLVTPPFIFLSQDGALDVLRGGASKIQTKQLDHLKDSR